MVKQIWLSSKVVSPQRLDYSRGEHIEYIIMKRPSTSLIVLITVLFIASCSLPFSGGKLEGTLTPIPENWSSITDADIIQIETNPAEPYSVNLWVTVMDNVPYIHAGKNRATWVEHLEQNPELLLGHEGSLYEVAAERVTSQEELERLSEPYKAKYGNYPRNMNIEEIYLYRLLPRGS